MPAYHSDLQPCDYFVIRNYFRRSYVNALLSRSYHAANNNIFHLSVYIHGASPRCNYPVSSKLQWFSATLNRLCQIGPVCARIHTHIHIRRSCPATRVNCAARAAVVLSRLSEKSIGRRINCRARVCTVCVMISSVMRKPSPRPALAYCYATRGNAVVSGGGGCTPPEIREHRPRLPRSYYGDRNLHSAIGLVGGCAIYAP